ncbi:SOS response-associated peptidase [soil metagenome]
MCYYKSLKIKHRDLLAKLEINREARDMELLENENSNRIQSGFEYSLVDIIIPKKDCKWDLVEMEWGFIPQYWWTRADVDKIRRGYMDEKTGKYRPPITTLNAIGEELLLNGKMYRDAALNRRCLFPATEFYEWRHIFPIGKKGQPLKTAVKYPYRIAVKDEEVFFIAGIWQPWTDRETGETIDTCALVTTKANGLMEQIHNSKKRMPAILTSELAGEWISDGLTEERITEIASFQLPAAQMTAHTIKKDFLSVSDADEHFEYQGLPALML